MENLKNAKLANLAEVMEEDVIMVKAQFICCVPRESQFKENGKDEAYSFYRCIMTKRSIDLGKYIINSKNAFIEGQIASDFIPEPNKVYNVGIKVPKYTNSTSNFAQVIPRLVEIYPS